MHNRSFLKKEQGFTLAEVIISIAILAIISGFILQMFIVSSRANQKAQNIDIANNEATSLIENFKASLSVNDFLKKNDLKNYQLVKNQASQQNDTVASYNLEQYFDSKMIATKKAEDKRYIAKVNIERDKEAAKNFINKNKHNIDLGNTNLNNLYKITVTIRDLKQVKNPVLANLTGHKYFVEGLN